MKYTLPFLLASVTALPALAENFEAGQRWSCVTDQGANAYMEVQNVEGQAISFSWGVINPSTQELDTLCNARDALSVEEMKEFCRVLGDGFSNGHVLLQQGCEAK